MSRSFLHCSLLLLLALSARSDAEGFTVRRLSILPVEQEQTGGERTLAFVVGGNAAVASRINDLVFIQTLESLAPRILAAGQSTLARPSPQGQTELSYRVERNDADVFSLTIEEEGCGAYCETYETRYSFAAASGRWLGVDDLFSNAGWEAFGKRLAAARQAQIHDAIRSLDREGAQGDDDLEGMKETYRRCSDLVADPLYASREFIITARSVVFFRERCSNHAARALDDLGEFANTYPFDALRPYLGDYGLHLLLHEGSASPPRDPLGQVLYGRIGDRYPITLLLHRPYEDRSLRGCLGTWK